MCVCVRVRVRVVCVVDGDAVEVQQAGLQARFRGGLADPAIVPERVAAAKARVWLMHVMAVGLCRQRLVALWLAFAYGECATAAL